MGRPDEVAEMILAGTASSEITTDVRLSTLTGQIPRSERSSRGFINMKGDSMRVIMLTNSIILTLFTIGCATSIGLLQQYRGERLTPTEESTLNFSALANIRVDGVGLRNMKQLNKEVDWNRYKNNNDETFSGQIKVKPGRHRVTIWSRWNSQKMGWAECEADFKPSMEYSVKVWNESIDDFETRHRNIRKYIKKCKIQ